MADPAASRLSLITNTDLEDTDAFDPDNDVRLVMRDDQTMLVSSRILASHSKVFAVMFNGCYSESVRLSANTKALAITQIDLPDDDAEAMSKLYDILQCDLSTLLTPVKHNRKLCDLWKAPPLSVGRLLKVAILADKYDCMKSLPFYLNVWLDSLLSRGKSPHEIRETARDRLAIGYLACLPRIFDRAGADLITFAIGPFDALLMEREIYADILPVCLPGEFMGHCTI